MLVLSESKGCSRGRLMTETTAPTAADFINTNSFLLLYSTPIYIINLEIRPMPTHLVYYCLLHILLIFGMLNKQTYLNNHPNTTLPHHQYHRLPAHPRSQPLNQRARCKSIHALTPSLLKPITPKNQRHPPSTAPQSARLTSSQMKDVNVIKSLFLDQQSVLRKLELETEALEKEKEQVIANNKEEYQRIMEKLMEMRKLCNKRRQDIEGLRNSLRELESKNSYQNIKDFSSRRKSERVQRAQPPYDGASKSKHGFLFTSYSTKPNYSIINSHINF